MVSIAVRQATSAEIELLLPLQKEIHDCHVAHHPRKFHTANRDELVPLLQQWFAEPNFRCIIASEGSAVVGYVFIWISEQGRNALLNARKFLSIDQLCVGSGCRRKGVGRALVEAVFALARENGIQDVQLTVWVDNVGAKAFYEKLGFTIFHESFVCSVDKSERGL